MLARARLGAAAVGDGKAPTAAANPSTAAEVSIVMKSARLLPPSLTTARSPPAMHGAGAGPYLPAVAGRFRRVLS